MLRSGRCAKITSHLLSLNWDARSSGSPSNNLFTTLPTADHEDKLYGTDENLDIVWEFVRKYL
ncbi:MAG: hypothetical protein LUH00_03905 [Lachnospiraceae bacterium]|nr:hypothetical protein [Lachnospiraceae bacterium]